MASDESFNRIGLPPDLQETAREAARQRGMPVEAWLQSVIRESAGGEKLRDAPDRARAGDPPLGPDLMPDPDPDMRPLADAPPLVESDEAPDRLTVLSRQIDEIAAASSRRTPYRRMELADDGDVAAALRAIEERLAALGAQGQKQDPGQDHRQDRPPEPASAFEEPATPPAAEPEPEGSEDLDIEAAVAEITARQHALDDGGDADGQDALAAANAVSGRFQEPSPSVAAQTVADLQDELKTLTEELRQLRQPGGLADTVAALRQQLSGIADRLSEAAPGHALQTLQSEVEILAGRIEEGRRRGFDDDATAAIESALADIRDAIARFAPAEHLAPFQGEVRALDQRIEALASGAPQAAAQTVTLQDLQRSIGDLHEIARHAATGAALDTLGEQVRILHERVDALLAPAGTVDAGPSVVPRDLDELHAHRLRDDDAQPSPPTSPQEQPDHGRFAAVTGHGSAEPAGTPPENPIGRSSLPADHPLEPDTRTGGERPMSAAERIAMSEAALGRLKQQLNPEPQGPEARSNFIAAARRAAQAAANMQPPASADDEAATAGRSSFGALARRLAGRKTLAMVLVVLLGGVALHFVTGTPQPAATGAEPLPRAPAAAPQQPAAPPAQRDAAAPARPAATEAAAAPEAPAVPSAPPFMAMPGVTGSIPLASGSSAGRSAPAATREGSVAPGVSPLAIASMTLPGGFGTNDPAAHPAPGPAAQAADDLPQSFGPALRTAALAGDPAAEYEVATRYAEGRGVRRNNAAAMHWFERAANRDLAPAQYRLGNFYEKGTGVAKDLERARSLYRAAAEQGNGKATHNLAVLYAEGAAGAPDLKTAALWFRKAARLGVADSQYNLGILYARGFGVEQNLAESYKWFALAAQSGDQDAAQKRDEVAGRVDRQALVAARLAVQTFQPDPEPEAAVTVKAPPGGWDEAKPAATGPRAPPARERGGSRS